MTLPAAQVQAYVEYLDELLAAYDPETGVLLVGHSIRASVIQEMLKARVGALVLFSAMSDIGKTPSGRLFSVRTAAVVVPGPWSIRCPPPSLTITAPTRPLVLHIARILPTLAVHARISLAPSATLSPADPLSSLALLAGEPAASPASYFAGTSGDLCISNDGR